MRIVVRFMPDPRYFLMRWGYPMRQNQLFLTLSDQGNRSRRELYRRNQPLAEWWFHHIRANLEAEEQRSATWPSLKQGMFRWH